MCLSEILAKGPMTNDTRGRSDGFPRKELMNVGENEIDDATDSSVSDRFGAEPHGTECLGAPERRG
jgi:hypothetical protein